jgi:hypothetical protein
MIDLNAATRDLVDTLTAAGISATTDPRDLNPPAVLVPPPSIDWRFGRGADATFEIVCAVVDTGAAGALPAVSALVDDVQTALRGAVTGGRPAALDTGSGGPPLPAYTLTLTRKLPERMPAP